MGVDPTGKDLIAVELYGKIFIYSINNRGSDYLKSTNSEERQWKIGVVLNLELIIL